MWNKSSHMKRKYMIQKFFYGLLLFLTIIVVAFVLGIIVYLVVKGRMEPSSWELFPRKPSSECVAGGISLLILYHLSYTGYYYNFYAIGILSARYLNEYAKKGD